MTNILHIHFNKTFNDFLETVDPDKAVMQTVGDISSNIIRGYSIIDRCPTKIKDAIRSQVGNTNLIIYAVLNNYVLVFIKYRKF